MGKPVRLSGERRIRSSCIPRNFCARSLAGERRSGKESLAEKSSPEMLAQSPSLYTGQLQRRLSDSHLHTYRLLEFRSKQPTRSRSYPSVKNLDCPLHQESTNTSPAASSSALESSSIKDHQLNQMMDCTSSENGEFHSNAHESDHSRRTIEIGRFGIVCNLPLN